MPSTPRTGQERWVYDPKVDRAVGAKACCDVVNRGVAVYDGKVFVGVIDGRLVALNAADGSVAWETVTVDQSQPYTITGAPRAANGLVYIGNGGAEYGVRGYVSAYDAKTGALRWRFYTVPGDPAKGPDDAASDPVMATARPPRGRASGGRCGGGGTVWDAIVYDPDFDQLIIGVGNGSPVEPADPFSRRWRQLVPLVDRRARRDHGRLQVALPDDARRYLGLHRHAAHHPRRAYDRREAPRKVAMQAPKNGFFYVVDARDRTAHFGPSLPADAARRRSTPTGAPSVGPTPSIRRPAAQSRTRKRATPVRRPSSAQVRSARTTGTRWPSARRRASSISRHTTWPSATAHDANPVRREGFWNLGIVIRPLPDDAAVRAAIRSSSKGVLIAWDPVSQSGGLARRQRRALERRDARHGGRPRLPGHGGRAVPRARRQDREGGLVVPTTRRRRWLARSATRSAASSMSPCSADTAARSSSSTASSGSGGPHRQRAGLRVQAGRQRAAAGRRSHEEPDTQAAGHSHRRRGLRPRRAPLRSALQQVSRCRRGERRRPSRPAPIATAPGRPRLAARRG